MRNFINLLKESFVVYKQKIKSFLIVLFLFSLLATLIVLVFGFYLVSKDIESLYSLLESIKVELFIFLLALFLITTFQIIPLFLITIKPKETPLKEIFKQTWKNYWNCLIVEILMFLFVLLGFACFIVPGIIISIYLGFSMFVLLIENKKGINALKGSWNLVKGNWWSIFEKIFLLNILTIIPSIIFQWLSKSIGLFNIISSVYTLLLLPFSLIFSYLIYQDLRKSKEQEVLSEEQILNQEQ